LRRKIGAIRNEAIPPGTLVRFTRGVPRLSPLFAASGGELTLGKPATIDTNESAICRLFHQKE